MARLAVIILGPPAAGKGTQARQMGTLLRFPVISTGDILREAVRSETDLGRKARAYMESGALVPDPLVDAIVKSRLGQEDCRKGFILDGYPRTIGQAQALEKAFQEDEVKILVIGISVEDDILVRRVAGRMSCPNCGKVFNATLLSGQDVARCDECETPLVSRKDDSAPVVKERLQVYHRQTQPLIEYYRNRGWYVEVGGDRPVDEVQAALVAVIKGQQQNLSACFS